MSEAVPVKQYDTTPMTVGNWLVTIILLAIPVVGIICLLYWSLSSTGNVNRRNYCLASLIVVAIFIVLAIIFAVFFGGMAALMSDHGTQM